MTMISACDISNHQGTITPDRQRCMAQTFPVVVVRLSTERQQLIDIGRQQIIALQSAGVTVLGYPWAYFNLGAMDEFHKVINAYDDLKLPAVFMDCEDEQNALSPDYNVIWLHQALEAYTRAGYQAGIYSGPYYWSQYLGNDQSFRDYVSWVAAPDGVQNLQGLASFGNAPVVAKQYDWYGSKCGISPLDLDVFDSDFIAGLKGNLTVEEQQELEYLRSWYGLVKGDYMDDLQEQKNRFMHADNHAPDTWAAIDEIQNIINQIRKG